MGAVVGRLHRRDRSRLQHAAGSTEGGDGRRAKHAVGVVRSGADTGRDMMREPVTGEARVAHSVRHVKVVWLGRAQSVFGFDPWWPRTGSCYVLSLASRKRADRETKLRFYLRRSPHLA